MGGEPVLDGGVPLKVGIKDIEEAEEVVQEIAGKRISSLDPFLCSYLTLTQQSLKSLYW